VSGGRTTRTTSRVLRLVVIGFCVGLGAAAFGALPTTDGLHYSFKASGKRAGLFTAATPYLTVEVQVGTAIFSNSRTFRHKGSRWVLP
jgi:hypothetical protein